MSFLIRAKSVNGLPALLIPFPSDRNITYRRQFTSVSPALSVLWAIDI